jgi:leucine-rich repeat protein SHOC2
VGQLKHLEFLTLNGIDMEGLPEAICHLSSLQFLDLFNCTKLQSLPPKIGELKNLKYLSFLGCYNLKIPHEISQLTSLTTLDAFSVLLSVEAESESEASIWSLKGLGNLTMLRTLRIKVNGFKEGIMGKWLDMRHLRLVFDDGVKADLPHDMTKMTKLQSFQMWSYSESSLPDYSYTFQHLEDIYLDRCKHLQELSPLERLPSLKGLFLHACDGLKELGIGFSGFLMLEKLVLTHLKNLESIAGPLNNGVWNESTLPKLRILNINSCPNLKRFPMGTDKLLKLNMIGGEKVWWQKIIWEDHDMQGHLETLFKEWTDYAFRSF